jgi:hypothetical protein
MVGNEQLMGMDIKTNNSTQQDIQLGYNSSVCLSSKQATLQSNVPDSEKFMIHGISEMRMNK